MSRIALIAAVSSNDAIGFEGKMPWHISADLKYFKMVTMGAPVIMGRKTFESIGVPLPGRANIVITRNEAFSPPNINVFCDVPSALLRARAFAKIDGSQEIFVIGGAEIYKQTISEADRIYLTEIDSEFPGDAFFPAFSPDEWRETDRKMHAPETSGAPSFSFVIYTRVYKKGIRID